MVVEDGAPVPNRRRRRRVAGQQVQEGGQLAGSVAGPVPLVPYEAARERMLNTHVDLETARNAERRARIR